TPFFLFRLRHPPRPPLFPYTTLFRSTSCSQGRRANQAALRPARAGPLAWYGVRRRVVKVASGSRRTSQLRASVDRRARETGRYRSEEHTSELQSRGHLVCRLLLEKKK